MKMDATDRELLEQFIKERSDEAFHELVRRHLPMVLATARRILCDSGLSEEVAQNVFVLLARKAPEVRPEESVAGWIYHSARLCAFNLRRTESRRKQREQTAALMQTNEIEPPRERFQEELEHAMSELSADDRDVLVVRFLEDRSLRDVGREIGIGEDAARKRVSRALDRLRDSFVKRGVTISASAVTALLAGEADAIVPAGLASVIAKTAIAETVVTSGTTTLIHQGTMISMKTLKLKTAAAIVASAIVTGTTVYLVQQRELDRLNEAKRAWEETRARFVSVQQEQTAAIQLRDQQIVQLQKEAADLPRLRADVDRLNRELAEKAQALTNLVQSQHAVSTQASNSEPKGQPTENWKEAVARIRSKMFGIGGFPTAAEIQWLQEAKPRIEQLERDPAQFAGFQTEMIKAIVPTLDAARQQQVSDIIRQTYEAAVAQGLDLPSKPSADTTDWVTRRQALDRLGTEEVQALLTVAEREQFDRRFIGIMGVDLGTGVDPSNYPPGFLGDPVPPSQ